MDTETTQYVGELRTLSGIAQTFSDWKTDNRTTGESREDFFRRRLSKHIRELEKQTEVNTNGVPVALSGMASSSIGMAELPYAPLPFALDGSGAEIRYVGPTINFPHDIGLISGVSSGRDVMRGEETQLIGLLSLLGWTGNPDRRGIFIFPGTHAKHLVVEKGQLTQFDTYMTGELFALMTTHSILAESVDATDLSQIARPDQDAFRRGVQQAQLTTALSGLFTVRTNELFNVFTKMQNALYLSGLLIGSELAHLVAKPDWPIVLCSSPNLSAVYELAIDELGLSSRTTLVPPDLIDRAAPEGQLLLYKHRYERAEHL